MSRENSMISDFDAPKDNVIDNISIYSNNGMGAFVPNNTASNSGRTARMLNNLSKSIKLEITDQANRNDMLESRSISEFSSDIKESGVKPE